MITDQWSQKSLNIIISDGSFVLESFVSKGVKDVSWSIK